MIRLGEALTTPDAGVGGPPVRALVVYNSNPAAVAPDRNAVLARHGARGSVHGRARAFPDRHRRLRRHRAARRRRSSSTGTSTSRTAITTSRSISRRSNRSANRCRTARSSAASPRGWGSTIRRCGDDDVTMIRQALGRRRARSSQGVTLRDVDGEGVDAAQRADAVPAVRRRAGSRRRRASASSTRRAWRRWDSIRCRRSRRRTSSRRTCRRSPARYPLTLISSPAHQFLNSTFVNIDSLRRGGARAGVPAAPDRRRAARDRRRRARGRAQRPRRVHRRGARRGRRSARASSGRRRSGGASSRRTARTRTRRRRSARRTWGTGRCFTTTWWRLVD